MIINNESYDRVQNALEEVFCCCETEDTYTDWDDIASEAIAAELEYLDADQLAMTVEAFKEYIAETAETDENLALGIRSALVIFSQETIDYLDDDSDYCNALRKAVASLKGMNV